jgi:hypothetical protein
MLDATDPDHERCAEVLEGSAEPRVVPVCVLVEVEHLLRPWPRASRRCSATSNPARSSSSICRQPTAALTLLPEIGTTG